MRRSDGAEVRRLTADYELLAAHVAQLRTEITDLTESVRILGTIAERCERRVMEVWTRLMTEGFHDDRETDA